MSRIAFELGKAHYRLEQLEKDNSDAMELLKEIYLSSRDTLDINLRRKYNKFRIAKENSE
jgi:hypothetical protein